VEEYNQDCSASAGFVADFRGATTKIGTCSAVLEIIDVYAKSGSVEEDVI